MFKSFQSFALSECGAVTVDWTVLSAAAVSMALATTALLNGTINGVEGRMDDELRSRQLSDDWIAYYAEHFEPVLQSGYMSEEQAEDLFDLANGMMNHDIITHLEEGIQDLEDGTITAQELTELIAVASVAYQRNVVDDATLDYYFGFGGSDPYYTTAGGGGSQTATN